MIEKHKKAFSELLRKIDGIDAEQSPSRTNHFDEFSKNIEDNYGKIQRSAVNKLENLGMVSDILSRIDNGNSPIQWTEMASLGSMTDRGITAVSEYLFFEMKEKLIPFYLKKAEWLYKQGKVDDALDAWEDVLKVNPDNQYVHSKMLEIKKELWAGKERAEEAHGKYQFKYIGSFGHNLFRRPYGIGTTGSENIIFVTDCLGNRICKFSAHGEYIGSTSLGLKNPRDMFKDTEGNVWICDFGNSRLLAVDSSGNKADEIMIIDIVGEKFGSIHPFQGCFNNGRFYLLLTDSNLERRKMVSFDMKGRVLLIDMPSSMFQRPSGIRFIGERLFVGDYVRSALFVYDFDHEQFFPFLKGALLGFLEFFVNINDSIFLSTRRLIVKISLRGEPVFMVRIDEVLDAPNVYPVGLAVLKEGDNQILLVSDYFQRCIHKFVI